jgi:DNA-binding GntR family transcriptional regulator
MRNLSPLPSGSRSLLADHAYRTLRDAILIGDLTPQTALGEAAVAERMGISRTPVREAIRRLEIEGLLLRTPDGRVVVSSITTDQLRQAFDLRKLLEGHAAAEAARQAKPPDLESLHRLVVEARAAVARGDVDLLPIINDRFHSHIEGLANNTVLSRITRVLREQTDAFPKFAVGQVEQQRGFIDDHEAITEALANGDATRAQALATSHLDTAQVVLIGEIERVAALKQPDGLRPSDAESDNRDDLGEA